jgi:hypothetical protein
MSTPQRSRCAVCSSPPHGRGQDRRGLLSGRGNVAVHAKEVVRVILGLDALDPFVVLPVRVGSPSSVVLR